MSVVPFTRQLGARSGVQLNPLIDNSERLVPGNTDQTCAIVGRFTRGRIDRAFRVNRSNTFKHLGKAQSIKLNALNEALVHVYDTLQNGTYEVVVSRLITAAAVNNYMIATDNVLATSVWTTAATLPGSYLVAVKHLECYNDGVIAEINGAKAFDTDGVTAIATKWVTLRLRDVVSGAVLHSFEGSLDPAAVNEFGASTYLPSVVESLTDAVEVTVFAGATIPTTSGIYGKDVGGVDKTASKTLVYFTEGGTSYVNTDYDAAINRLEYGDSNFGYIIGGGTQAVALLSKLILAGIRLNKQVLWDIPGNLSPSAAITFYKQLNIDSHYSQAYWAPLQTDDPINGGKGYIGTSCINAGLRCARNAVTNSNGLAKKNWPIAGKEHPIARTGPIQKYTPTDQELDDLASARINPVIYQRFNAGGKFVFFDSLTGAKSDGDRKLIAVADMSSAVDDWVTLMANESLQLPIVEAVRRIGDFLQNLFEALQAAEWIKPSPALDGAAFQFSVEPNALRPNDRVDVNYWLKYDGTTRAIHVQQTLSK